MTRHTNSCPEKVTVPVRSGVFFRRAGPWYAFPLLVGQIPVLNLILLLALIAAIPVSAQVGEQGKPFITGFRSADYDADPSNYDITQGPDGVIYVANRSGILEYDGVSWETVPLPGAESVFSLATDSRGTLYVGKRGDLGLMMPDSAGFPRFVSLLDQVPENFHDFGTVRQTLYTRDGIFFRTDRRLFRWQPDGSSGLNGSMQAWDIQSTLLSDVQGRLVLHQPGVGLLELRGKLLQQIPGGDAFADVQPVAVMPFGGDTLLVCLRKNGVFLYSENGRRSLAGDAATFSRQYLANDCIALGEGRFAVSTDRGGLAVFDRSGALLQVVDRSSGLTGGLTAPGMFLDREGELWLPLSDGLARISLSSGVTFFDGSSGLEGAVLAILRHQGQLYLGTARGAFLLKPGVRPGETASFRPVRGIQGAVYDLLSVNNQLFAAADDGMYEILLPDSSRKILNMPGCLALGVTRDRMRLHIGTVDNGLQSMRFVDGSWIREGGVTPAVAGRMIRSLVVDGLDDVWCRVETRDGAEIRRVHFEGDMIRTASVIQYDAAHGLPDMNNVTPMAWNGRLYIAGDQGLFRYDSTRDRFAAVASFDNAIFERLKEYHPGMNEPSVDSKGRLWFQIADNLVTWFDLNGENGAVWPSPLRDADLRRYSRFFPDAGGTVVWAGGADGRLVRWEEPQTPPVQPEQTVLIREVSTLNGVVLFHGNPTPAQSQLVLSGQRNFIRMRFSTPLFSTPGKIEYRTRLSKVYEEWSPWSKKTYREFANLPRGEYSFLVQSRTPLGPESAPASLRFRVSAPWYFTLAAFLLYGAGVVFIALVVAVILQLRRRRIAKMKLEMTEQAEERTREAIVEYQRKHDEQLREQSLETANRLGATIAHEFNNPMAIIQGMCDLEEIMHPDDSATLARLDRIREQVTRMQSLVAKLVELRSLKEVDYAAGVKILDLHLVDETPQGETGETDAAKIPDESSDRGEISGRVVSGSAG